MYAIRSYYGRGEKDLTLQQIIAHFQELDFEPGDDWFIWYAHFGEPDVITSYSIHYTKLYEA